MGNRRLLTSAPRLRAVLRYGFGVATSGLGLVDKDYRTLHWTPVHEFVWRNGSERTRDFLTRRIISVQWHHHDVRNSGGRTWSAEETSSGFEAYKDSVKSSLEKYFFPNLTKDLDVLELGSGIGVGAILIAPRARSYYGVDVSKPSVRASEHLTRSMSNVKFRCNNGLNLDFISDDSFDLIHCGGTFMHMDLIHVYGYLKEFFRVLRAGGRICISYPNFENNRWFEGFVKSAPRQIDLPYSSLASYRVRYLTSRMMRRMLEEIGFEDMHFFRKESPEVNAEMSEADHCWAKRR